MIVFLWNSVIWGLFSIHDLLQTYISRCDECCQRSVEVQLKCSTLVEFTFGLISFITVIIACWESESTFETTILLVEIKIVCWESISTFGDSNFVCRGKNRLLRKKNHFRRLNLIIACWEAESTFVDSNFIYSGKSWLLGSKIRFCRLKFHLLVVCWGNYKLLAGKQNRLFGTHISFCGDKNCLLGIRIDFWRLKFHLLG